MSYFICLRPKPGFEHLIVETREEAHVIQGNLDGSSRIRSAYR